MNEKAVLASEAADVIACNIGTRLEVAFAKLERGRNALLADLEGWGEDSLSRRPASDAWSALDVVEHVIKFEQDSATEIPRNLPNCHTVSVAERMKAFALAGGMRMPARFKMPPSLEFLRPIGDAPLRQLESDWRLVRAQLQALVQDKKIWTSCGVYRHPIAGWMSMPDLVNLLEAHQRHHVYQLHRLRRALAA